MSDFESLAPHQKKALRKIVLLSRQNDLNSAHIQAALNADTQDEKTSLPVSFLTGLLGYLGGALILSGLFIFSSIIWKDIGSFPRVVLSLGSGMLALTLATMLQKKPETTKASAPLWLISALLIPTGLFVFLKEYADGDDVILGATLVFGTCTLTYLVAFLQFRKTIPLALFYLFALAFAGTLYEHLGINTPMMWLVSGISFALVSWKTLTSKYEAISDLPMLIAGAMLLSSVYYYFGNTPAEGIIVSLLLGMLAIAYRTDRTLFRICASIIFVCEIAKNFGFSFDYRDSDVLRLSSAVTGVSILFFGDWVRKKTDSRIGAPLANFFGSGLIFSAFMALLYDTPYDILFPMLPAFMLYMSLRLQSRALMFSSILGLLGFISYYSFKYFADVLGWPIVLMITGMALIGLCSIAMKLSARMKTRV